MTREEILTIARPILFNTDMVKATLDDKKSATRRIMKPQPLFKTYRKFIFDDATCPKKWEDCDDIIQTYKYQTGDYLYVRETWMMQAAKRYDALVRIGYRAGGKNTTIHFPYGGTDSINRDDYDAFVGKWNLDRWYPSIHMPKEAARIFLRVTDVRVERLQDISGHEVLAEGVDNDQSNPAMGKRWENMQRIAFSELWNSTIPKKDLDKYEWAANPWVWVIEFERVKV